MGLKQCAKCSEMVDEAKAFCPGCGNAFVEEEKRQQASEFEKLDNTVQFGQTMYNQMLSDMGLNISKTPPPEKRIEVIAPAATTTVIKPAAAATELKQPAPAPAKSPGNKKWYLLGGLLVALIAVLTLAATALLYVYWTGYRF